LQHRKDDFAFILNGILSVLADFTAVTNNLLPGSKKPVPYILEICECGPPSMRMLSNANHFLPNSTSHALLEAD
jgi:hypothetical protein